MGWGPGPHNSHNTHNTLWAAKVCPESHNTITITAPGVHANSERTVTSIRAHLVPDAVSPAGHASQRSRPWSEPSGPPTTRQPRSVQRLWPLPCERAPPRVKAFFILARSPSPSIRPASYTSHKLPGGALGERLVADCTPRVLQSAPSSGRLEKLAPKWITKHPLHWGYM